MTSPIAISMPFAGTIAWTPLLLLGADGFIRERWPRNLSWLALAALAWGQVAVAHLSHGLVVASVLLVAVGVGHGQEARRERDRMRSPPSR